MQKLFRTKGKMFRQPGGMRRRIMEIAQKFREKGATSPERAMTAQELGLPPRFEEAMKRRLGQTGIFVEVGGKYYLNEARLVEIQQQRGMEGGVMSGIWRTMMTLRIARMVVVVVLLITILTNLFVRNTSVWILVVGLISVPRHTYRSDDLLHFQNEGKTFRIFRQF